MEDLISEAIKNPNSNMIWALLVWVLAREFLPGVIKKFRNGKTPYLEIVKEKVDFLFLREKKRETIEEYQASQRIRRSTDKKES
jgi:hypothetical protein